MAALSPQRESGGRYSAQPLPFTKLGDGGAQMGVGGYAARQHKCRCVCPFEQERYAGHDCAHEGFGKRSGDVCLDRFLQRLSAQIQIVDAVNHCGFQAGEGKIILVVMHGGQG